MNYTTATASTRLKKPFLPDAHRGHKFVKLCIGQRLHRRVNLFHRGPEAIRWCGAGRVQGGHHGLQVRDPLGQQGDFSGTAPDIVVLGSHTLLQSRAVLLVQHYVLADRLRLDAQLGGDGLLSPQCLHQLISLGLLPHKNRMGNIGR